LNPSVFGGPSWLLGFKGKLRTYGPHPQTCGIFAVIKLTAKFHLKGNRQAGSSFMYGKKK
jgi:hypothetical protein